MKNTIKDLITYGIKELEKANIEEPTLKSKILLAFVINKTKEYLVINKEEIVKQEEVEKYNEGIEKLKQNIPIQYITNYQEFMGLSFYVNENVLIPRFDTEVLVEEVLSLAKNKENLKILDVCTGSGAIAISVAKTLKNSKVYATDISKKALKVAKRNNKTNQTNVEFIHSNMFTNIFEKEFDIIVSNPPYIETTTIEQLNKDVKQEPVIALDGGKDGLDFYRILANYSYEYLKPNGILAMEIGYNQKESVTELLKNTGKYENIYCKKDLNGNDRIILCKKEN